MLCFLLLLFYLSLQFYILDLETPEASILKFIGGVGMHKGIHIGISSAVGAVIGSRFGPVGAGIGAVVGVVIGTNIPSHSNSNRKIVTVNPTRILKSTNGENPVASSLEHADEDQVICKRCDTKNSKINLLCEYCGERLK